MSTSRAYEFSATFASMLNYNLYRRTQSRKTHDHWSSFFLIVNAANDTGPSATAFERSFMFRVENADFIADKLATELLPNQEFREVLKNALEAVQRRMRAHGASRGGRIEFDVDWSLYAQSAGHWFVCCVDNGDGMGRSQLEKYTKTLA